MITSSLLALVTGASLPAVAVQGRAERQAVTVVLAEPMLQERPVADWLASAPGVFAAERANFAPDTQLSVRGFGAGSPLGVRGVRVLVDGIPAIMPDGSGSLSHVPLASFASIAVLRSPFSALYGSNSGGVSAFTTATTKGDEPTRIGFQACAFGERLCTCKPANELATLHCA